MRCNFFSKLVEGAYVHSIARREPRRLPACCKTLQLDWLECPDVLVCADWTRVRREPENHLQVWGFRTSCHESSKRKSSPCLRIPHFMPWVKYKKVISRFEDSTLHAMSQVQESHFQVWGFRTSCHESSTRKSSPGLRIPHFMPWVKYKKVIFRLEDSTLHAMSQVQDSHLQVWGFRTSCYESSTRQSSPGFKIPQFYKKVISRFEDSALHGDTARCVDVVSGHHAYGDAGLLTLANCVRYLHADNVNNGHHLDLHFCGIVYGSSLVKLIKQTQNNPSTEIFRQKCYSQNIVKSLRKSYA